MMDTTLPDFLILSSGLVHWLKPENRHRYLMLNGRPQLRTAFEQSQRSLSVASPGLKLRAIFCNSLTRTAAPSIPLRGIALKAKAESSRFELWMFAPAGDHTITPAAGEGSAEVTLRIDESTATILNAKLAELNAKNAPQRAYFDREHDESEGATAWPVRFVWSSSPHPGVYAESVITALGSELVDGKIVRAFSPSFYSDAALPRRLAKGQHVKISSGQRGSAENPARMTGLVFPACGTLTNNPAFRKIQPLWTDVAFK